MCRMTASIACQGKSWDTGYPDLCWKQESRKEQTIHIRVCLCTGLQIVLRECDKFCGVHIFDDKDKDFKRFVAYLDFKMIELAKNGIKMFPSCDLQLIFNDE